MHILSPVTDNLLFLKQQKREKNLLGERVDLGASCKRGKHTTEQATGLGVLVCINLAICDPVHDMKTVFVL